MKAIIVMYDSLVKNLLQPYGCQWTKTPNFQRLAQRTVKFENCYVGSLPCMPARREMHTGRYNFFTRSWGPLEPYDESMPENLMKNGIHTHLISDHYHYWEEGGANYHTHFGTWEIVRGQEGDKWKAQLKEPKIPEKVIARPTHRWRQDWVNRGFLDEEEKQPQTVTWDLAMEFLDLNGDCDSWLLQIECFDPHEPFFTQQSYKDLYPHTYAGPFFDWPPYRQIKEDDPEGAREHIRCQYAALLSMCDRNLGRLLDKMDEKNMWEDTMLIVNTDHGFMLGEHSWWGKNVGPTYNEIANIPLFIWDPRHKLAGETRNALVQTIDLAPTIYNYFQVQIPESVMGKDLENVIVNDIPVRCAAVYGSHGGNINCTDGRYVYMRAPDPDNDNLFNYTLNCSHMCQGFTREELEGAELTGPFGFTNGYPVLKVKKIKPKTQSGQLNMGDFLFDLKQDPHMEHSIHNEEAEYMMKKHIVEIMKENSVPEEVYVRYRLRKE
ncbi:MAG: sulfatase [Lachnoclostridium edouardi]|uniref:sulfatase n=1 Tax=Lachnoclostridium edouardi TaxID=1926283 RepID=UPI0026DAFBBA|nr:sulfatase [Lachnoclostridium edouardi]MDO4279245.1 sulfatase [Lachnoclostridium edouardi]